MSKDYYKTLEIEEFESAEKIKAAYRRLARKWHPDVAGNTPDVLRRFKEINEAYSVLSNKVKKEEYDRARRFYNYANNVDNSAKSSKTSAKSESNINNEDEKKTATNPNGVHNRFGFNWEEFIANVSRERGYKREEQAGPIRGKDINADIEISFYEALNGVTKAINMLQTEPCPKCHGKSFANGSVCQHCMGTGKKTNQRRFSVRIPAGIKNNSKIRLAGEGDKGLNGGVNGDLYITVRIAEPADYRVEGLNIFKTVPITPYEAVLGSEIKIGSIGGNISLKLSPKTQNGQKFRLAGCGVRQNNVVGDMIVTVEIKIPKNLSSQEVELYKKLSELSSDNIRENIYDG